MSNPVATAATAFSPHASAEERFDAMAELQKSHTDLSSLMPRADVQPVIDYILADLDDQQLAKSARGQVAVPYPSKNAGQPGRQSVVLDDLQIAIMGDYIERPGVLGFDALRSMVDQTPVLSAVVMTRVRQMQAFCKVQESGFGHGFVVRHADVANELTQQQRQHIDLLQKFFLNTGWEFKPRARRRMGRQSLRQFMALSVRDSLMMDSAPIETEFRRNAARGLDGFYAVDGSTIRLCTEEGYQGDDEVFALQVVNGQIRTAYDHSRLIYEPRNPRTDVMAAGYGVSETELLIKVVTGVLNAMTLNLRGFSDNSIPRGILHLSGNYSTEDLATFKRYWNGMVKGVNNAWSMPVLVSKDQESKANFESLGAAFEEMAFAKWMTFLTSIICAIYGMSPAEINFDSFSGGSTSPLAGSDTEQKLAASKDSGLRPLLAYYESIFSDYILAEFGSEYVFRWTGVDADDADKRHELKKATMSVNEARAELGLSKQKEQWGEAPLNPALIGPWQQALQAQQQAQEQNQKPDMAGNEQAPGFGGDDGDDDGSDASQEASQGGDDQEGGKPPQDDDPAAGGAPLQKSNDNPAEHVLCKADDEIPVPSVAIHDHVFFHHPKAGPSTGKVLAHGKDGFMVEHASGERVGVPWADYLGHKERAQRSMTELESGEAGRLMRDDLTGKVHFFPHPQALKQGDEWESQDGQDGQDNPDDELQHELELLGLQDQPKNATTERAEK